MFASAAVTGLLFTARILASAPTQDTYRRAVDGWRDGSGDPAALESWGDDQIERAVSAAVAEGSGWTWRDLRAAALLHTRIWFVCARTGCGRDAMPHVRAAEAHLAAVLQREPRQAYFVERWYEAAAHLFTLLGRGALSDDLRRRARERLELSGSALDARTAHARGLEFEHLASVGNFAGRSTDIADRRRGALVGAAAGFERAVRADPGFHAAFLHLGRVRMLQDDEAEAAKGLEVAARADDPAVAYLARLFAGSLAERGGRFEEAEAHYRTAVSVYPSGQKGLMALAQLLGRTGREAEARQLMEAALRDGRSRSVDPYWTYLVPPRIGLGQVAAWLDELGVEARR